MWCVAKGILLFLAVLIGLRLGLEFMMLKVGAENHIENLIYTDWIQMSLAITAAFLFYNAMANWVLRQDRPMDDYDG